MSMVCATDNEKEFHIPKKSFFVNKIFFKEFHQNLKILCEIFLILLNSFTCNEMAPMVN